jgi:hypothetical protein
MSFRSIRSTFCGDDKVIGASKRGLVLERTDDGEMRSGRNFKREEQKLVKILMSIWTEGQT